MKKSTIKALGKGLQQEFKLPEYLPVPLQEALKALADLPAEVAEEGLAEKPRKCSTGL